MKCYTDTIPLPLAEKLKEKVMPIRIDYDTERTDATFGTCFDWEKVRIQAAIAAMPIANNIVDNLYSADYHGTEVSKLHSIEKFTQECVAIADALIEELKKEKIDI